MKNKYLVIVLTLFNLTFIPNTVKADVDICEGLKRYKTNITDESKFFDWFKKVFVAPTRFPKLKREYYYSVKSGVALKINCDAAKLNRQYDDLIYYPVGTFFTNLLPYTISYKGRDYYPVISEYGMEMFVLKNNVVKVNNEHGSYIFVNSANNIPYCAKKEGCGDPIALGKRKLILTSNSGGKDGVGRYGVVAHRENLGDCSEYTFMPYELGERKTNQTTFVSECWSGFKQGNYKIKYVEIKKKIVDLDNVRALSGKFGSFSKNHFAKLDLSKLKNNKSCLEEDVYAKKGEAGIGGDYYIFSGKLNASFEKREKRKEGKFHYFMHYSLGGKGYGIEAISYCKNQDDEPNKPGNIRVYHDGVDDYYFPLNVQGVINSYAKDFNLSGFKAARPGMYRRGKFFLICGAIEYFNLRDSFLKNIKIMDQLDEIINAEESDISEETIYNFYSHLLIASSSKILKYDQCKKNAANMNIAVL